MLESVATAVATAELQAEAEHTPNTVRTGHRLTVLPRKLRLVWSGNTHTEGTGRSILPAPFRMEAWLVALNYEHGPEKGLSYVTNFT